MSRSGAVRGRGRRRGQPRQPREVHGDGWGDAFRSMARRPGDARAAARREPRGARPRLLAIPGGLVLALPRVAGAGPTRSGRSGSRPTSGCSGAASGRRSRSRSGRWAASSGPGGCRRRRCWTGSGRCCPRAPAGTAKAGLDLGRGRRGRRTITPRAAIVATEGLRHPRARSRRRRSRSSAGSPSAPDPELAAVVAARLPEVARRNDRQPLALVERLGGRRRRRRGVGDVTGRRSGGRSPAAVRSPLDPSRAIEPVASLEALVDVAVSVARDRRAGRRHRARPRRASAALPTSGPSLPRPPRRADREARRTLLGRRESLPFNGFDAQADVAGVLLAWTTGEVVGSAGPPDRRCGAGAFLSARAREAAEELPAASAAVDRLADPSWRLDRAAALLVERLATSPPASSLDLVAAVLRLAGEGRREALAAAGGLRGEVGAVVRYALGGEESIGQTAAWWVAAARVRSPGIDDEVVDRRHPGLGPEAGRAATDRAADHEDGRQGRTRCSLWTSSRRTGALGVDLPTALMLRRRLHRRGAAALTRRCFAGRRRSSRPTARVGSGRVAADRRQRRLVVGRLGEPGVPRAVPGAVDGVGTPRAGAPGIALGAKEAGERGLATDVARLAIADGRLEAAAIARGFASAAALGSTGPAVGALARRRRRGITCACGGGRRGDRLCTAVGRAAARRFAGPAAPAARRAAGRTRAGVRRWARGSPELVGVRGQAGRPGQVDPR